MKSPNIIRFKKAQDIQKLFLDSRYVQRIKHILGIKNVFMESKNGPDIQKSVLGLKNVLVIPKLFFELEICSWIQKLLLD